MLTQISSVLVDADGDGRMDRFTICTVAALTNRTSGVDWGRDRMRVRFGAGGGVERFSDFWTGTSILGATDLNEDGSPEVWVFIGGATAHNVGLISFQGGTPIEVTDAQDSLNNEFLFGVSGTFACCTSVGVSCMDWDKDGSVDIVEFERQEPVPEAPFPVTERWSYVAHAFDGRHTRVIARGEGGDLRTEPNALWAAGLDCDGLRRQGLGGV